MDITETETEIAKLMAQTSKLNAKTSKMFRERAWFPMILITAAFTSGAAVAKLLTG